MVENSGTVGQWGSGAKRPLSACRLQLSAIPFPPSTCHPERTRRMVGGPTKRKAMLNFSFPLEGNAAKRQRVYEVKNDNVAPLLLYTGPTLVDSRILCRMRAVRIVSDGMPINTSRREG
jgi:hypothetical protein